MDKEQKRRGGVMRPLRTVYPRPLQQILGISILTVSLLVANTAESQQMIPLQHVSTDDSADSVRQLMARGMNTDGVPDPGPGMGWQLTFSDEFDGTSLDTSKWNTSFYSGHIINNELQAYVPDAFSVHDGVVDIKTEKRDAYQDGQLQHYTSGMLSSHDKCEQQYGYFEIRAKLPPEWLWPAFWMYGPDVVSGGAGREYDIMEHLSSKPAGEVQAVIHWDGYGADHKAEGTYWTVNTPNDFHTYGLDWQPGYSKFYYDGNLMYTTTNSASVPEWMMVNTAVDRTDKDSLLPALFTIDYVRVYQKVPSSSTTPPSITTQPSNQTVTVRQTATFSIAATGTTPFSYQWQKNGGNITGATSTSYTTPVTTMSDNGSTFRCVVRNSVGNATSNSATLNVNAPLPIQLASWAANVIRDSDVEITWKTVSETNNYGFEIQRKRGETGDWKKVGFVEGRGSTLSGHSYSYIDRSVSSGEYYYHIKQIDLDGGSETFPEMEVIVGVVAGQFNLLQSYPNPFNPTTTIEYVLPEPSKVSLKLYNMLGQEVVTLAEGQQSAGYFSVTWDGRDADGNHISSGVYVYRFTAKGASGKTYTSLKKMMMLK
jgi:beta-glucanase (GH16 family)